MKAYPKAEWVAGSLVQITPTSLCVWSSVSPHIRLEESYTLCRRKKTASLDVSISQNIGCRNEQIWGKIVIPESGSKNLVEWCQQTRLLATSQKNKSPLFCQTFARGYLHVCGMRWDCQVTRSGIASLLELFTYILLMGCLVWRVTHRVHTTSLFSGKIPLKCIRRMKWTI